MKKKIMFGVVVILIASISISCGLFLFQSYQVQKKEAQRYTVRQLKVLVRELGRESSHVDGNDSDLVKKTALRYKIQQVAYLGGEDTEYVLQGEDGDVFNESEINARYVLDSAEKKNDGEEAWDRYDTSFFSYGNRDYCIAGTYIVYFGDSYAVSVVHDVTENMTNIKKAAAGMVLVNFFVILAGSLASVQFLKASFVPMEVLKEKMNAFAEGGYETRVNSKRPDEVGELSRHFDRMADSISAQMEEQNMLFHALAHEMKTPVTAIVGYSFALQSGNINEAQKREAVSFIESESRRLERLSSKLTDLIFSDKGEAASISVMEFTALLKGILTKKAEEKAVNVELELPEADYAIAGDVDLLCMMITNLFDNACKAGAGNVTLGFLQDKWWVKDDGCGISPEETEKIRKPFYQGDQSRNREGFGLGLAICERIAKLHGMELGIESEPGAGTVVRLEFKNR